MFKLAAVRKVTWPVTVSIPKDGGDTVKATFSGEFEVLTQDELEKNHGDLLDRVLVGWKGVAGEDEQEVAFSPEAKANMLGITYVRAALFSAYGELQVGRAAARKN